MNAEPIKKLRQETEDILRNAEKRMDEMSQIQYETGFMDCILAVVQIPGLPNAKYISEHLLTILNKSNGQTTEITK